MICDDFYQWYEWKNPEFNFSNQNIITEYNFFKLNGKVTKILRMMKQKAGNFKSVSFENTFKEIWILALFTASLTTSAAVQNSNAGGKQLARHTLKVKSVSYYYIFWKMARNSWKIWRMNLPVTLSSRIWSNRAHP